MIMKRGLLYLLALLLSLPIGCTLAQIDASMPDTESMPEYANESARIAQENALHRLKEKGAIQHILVARLAGFIEKVGELVRYFPQMRQSS
jgi:hypothetical protein